MKTITLANNSFVALGAKNAALYNLKTGKLYSLPSKAIHLLVTLVEKSQTGDDGSLTDDEKLMKIFSTKEKIQIPNKIAIQNQNKKRNFFNNIDFAWIEVSSKCNLKCLPCYEESTMNGDFMKWNDFTYLVDQLSKYNIPSIQLVGGEPLMHNMLEEMIMYAHDKFEFIEVYSNLTMLSEKMAN